MIRRTGCRDRWAESPRYWTPSKGASPGARRDREIKRSQRTGQARFGEQKCTGRGASSFHSLLLPLHTHDALHDEMTNREWIVQVRTKLKLAEERLGQVLAQREKDVKTIEQLEEKIRNASEETSKSMIQQANDFRAHISKAEAHAKESHAACKQVSKMYRHITDTLYLLCTISFSHVVYCLDDFLSRLYLWSCLRWQAY